MPRTVYTIGHSDRSLEEFLDLLRRHRVEVVVDVRRWPTSRHVPHFRREALEAALREAGMEYVWLGESLGGYRRPDYETYMGTEDWARGYEELRRLATSRVVAVMCSERLWFKCHRRFIADRLVRDGFRVLHIIDKKRVQEHRGPRGSRCA